MDFPSYLNEKTVIDKNSIINQNNKLSWPNAVGINIQKNKNLLYFPNGEGYIEGTFEPSSIMDRDGLNESISVEIVNKCPFRFSNGSCIIGYTPNRGAVLTDDSRWGYECTSCYDSCNSSCYNTCYDVCNANVDPCAESCTTGCTGFCYSGCTNVCTSGCYGSCAGCTGCTTAEAGCNIGCYTGDEIASKQCGGCLQGVSWESETCSFYCAGLCHSFCNGCASYCTGSCVGGCFSMCQGCTMMCQAGCTSSCAGGCTGTCASTYSPGSYLCGNGQGGCGGSCATGCTSSCAFYCYTMSV